MEGTAKIKLHTGTVKGEDIEANMEGFLMNV